MDMRFKLACPAIFIGNAIAAIIVMVVSYGVEMCIRDRDTNVSPSSIT